MKLAQKVYKTKHDRVGKVIHLELCKKLKFDHTITQTRIRLREWNIKFSGILKYKRIRTFDSSVASYNKMKLYQLLLGGKSGKNLN